MAGLRISAEERAQLAAIARLRWRIFSNSLRTLRGRLEMASRAVTAVSFGVLGLGGTLGMGAASYYLVSRDQVEWLALPFWAVLFFWQTFPLMASAFAENYDLSNLLRFPLRYRSYFLVRVAYGSLDPGTGIGCLWLAGVLAGIGLAAPGLLPCAVLLCVVFGLMNILLARMIFAWIERWLARRRTREVIGLLFFLAIISVQFIGPLFRRYGHGATRGAARSVEGLLPLERALPPGLAAVALRQVHQAHFPASLAAFALICGYGAAFGWLLNLRLHAQFQGENLGETAAARVRAPLRKTGALHGWKLPGIPEPVAAVFEKEIRYFSRSGPMLFTVVMPVVILMIFALQMSAGRGGHMRVVSGLAFPLAAAYAILILSSLVGNNLGPDGAGVQFFFASPAQFRSVMLGKNLAHAAVIVADVLLVWIAARWMFGPPSPALTCATIAGILFAVPLDFAVGNVLSLYSPKKIDFGAFGRQKPPSSTQFVSLGVQAVVFGLAAIAFLVGRHSAGMWITTSILLALAAGSFAGYAAVLRRTDRLALGRREILIAELSKT